MPCETARANALPMSDTNPTPVDDDTTSYAGFPRQKCAPVSVSGRMVNGRYQPENHEWLDLLTIGETGHRIGLDPMAIDTAILTAAGHPPRETRRIIGAMGDVPLKAGMKRHKDLRRHCVEMCAENSAEVRRCAIINCPIWPYRMGRNPHNPQRGVLPAAFSKESNNA